MPPPRRDPLSDEVALNNWHNGNAMPFVAGGATPLLAFAVNRKGRRDRNQHRRSGGAEKQFVHDTLRSPPDQSIRWRWWNNWPGPPFGVIRCRYGRSNAGLRSNEALPQTDEACFGCGSDRRFMT